MVPVNEISVPVRGESVTHVQSTEECTSMYRMILVDGHSDMEAHTFAEHAKHQVKYVLHKYWVNFGGREALSDTVSTNTFVGGILQFR